MQLTTNITELGGVGQKIALLYARLGIHTVGDLIQHFPRRYEDYSQVTSLSAITPGQVTLKVVVKNVTTRYVRKGLHITSALLDDGSGSVKATWFNQPYREKQILSGQEYYCSGTYAFSGSSYGLVNPSLERVSEFPKNTARILPIYPETKGLKSHSIRKLMARVQFDSLDIETGLPYRTKLSRKTALQMLHFPKSTGEISQAYSFFEFEELFSLMLAAAKVKKQNEKFKANPLDLKEKALTDFVSELPFKLTDDQRKVAWQALRDMSEIKPMSRLIEGDVGSGKTVVAALAALNAVENGSQVAIMVPTEVLAWQHLRNFQKLFKKSNVNVAGFVGSLKKSEKDVIKAGIASGGVQIVIGTHALIQDKVFFNKLDLVIIDEQHRFGVGQRNALVGKSGVLPHVLTMTATPIPRTLALTVFGDLDVSLIKQMPAGRKVVKTKIVAPNSVARAHELIRSELDAGRQAFIVYPLIEESENLEAQSAIEAHKKLTATAFKKYRVGLLHGKMKSVDKDAMMSSFVRGEIDVLIATTVIEVGVDVPNASVMLIEGAERFGLAQIHQLRGRVGRGEHQAYCILVPSTSQLMTKRLRALETISDGFKLAEYDLQLRGPGAIYGHSQHGQLDLRFTKLDNNDQIAACRELVKDFMNSGEDLLKYPGLADKVNKFKAVTHLN